MSGFGVVTYNTESHIDRFEGNFKEDEPNDDFGTLYWKNRIMFVGGFQGWNFTGNGTKFSFDGNVIEDGEWEGNVKEMNSFRFKENGKSGLFD
jgi:hypothetical protein